MPRPAQLKYVACVYGEEEDHLHLPSGISQGRLLENREQTGLQWSDGSTWYQGKKAMENDEKAGGMMPLRTKIKLLVLKFFLVAFVLFYLFVCFFPVQV